MSFSQWRYKPGLSDATDIMFKHFTAGTNCNRFSQWEAVLKEKLNLGHNNVKYYVPVWVKIAIDFRSRPKGFYPSERRLVREISWIISEGFTEVSGLLSSSVCNFCSSGTAVHPCCAHCWVSLPPLIQTNHSSSTNLTRDPLVSICLDSWGAVWTGQAEVMLKDGAH